MDNGEHYSAESVEDNRKTYSKESKPWLALIEESETYFREYQAVCARVEKQYAELGEVAAASEDDDYAMFWANLEVLKPAVYSRPPVPVAVPRFKDRRPLPRKTAEVLERAIVTTFEIQDVDGVMRCIRDDLLMNGRGVPWPRYEYEEGETEKVCWDYVDRTDFLYEPARKWLECGWVARRAHLTREKMRARFSEYSGDAYLKAAYSEKIGSRGEDDTKEAKGEKRAAVWEIWHKTEKKVVWVTKGVEEVLDIDEPPLDLQDFFPCPRPAFGTLQPRTLIPVPDFHKYRGQLSDITELTARIAALMGALKVKGFYAAGAEDVGDALERLMDDNDNRATLVPISNFAAFGGASLKDAIVWWPVADVATVLKECVDLRRVLIDDVYQITGLSDIMRGETDSRETLGAQQLKSQFGQIRLRDKQGELVRIARDMARITAEIIAENFQMKTIMELSQVHDLPSDQDIEQRIMEMMDRAERLSQSPQVKQMAQQDPRKAEAMIEQATAHVRQQVEKMEAEPTVEKVYALLQDQKIRPFALDIETDSTIQPDEDAEKQRRTEFVTAVGGFVREAAPVIQIMPQTAPLFAEVLKFLAAPFRAGRELQDEIEEFADQIKQGGVPQPQQEGKEGGGQQSPEQDKAKAAVELQKGQMAVQKEQIVMQQKQIEHEGKMAEIQARMEKLAADIEAKQIEVEGKAEDRMKAQYEATRSSVEQETKMGEAALKEAAKLDLEERKIDAQRQAANAKSD